LFIKKWYKIKSLAPRSQTFYFSPEICFFGKIK
ncbi:ABC transporter permease, partial [Listeria monocytogenes]